MTSSTAAASTSRARSCASENDGPVADVAVNEAFDGAGATYDFYKEVFERDSVDDKGAELVSSVHYGDRLRQRVLERRPDGLRRRQRAAVRRGRDDQEPRRHRPRADPRRHQYTAGLEYSKQSGANNEHMSDVFGSLVKQYSKGQTAEDADWLIGEGILVDSLRPGAALDEGARHAWKFDDQPAHMDDYRDLPDDNDPQERQRRRAHQLGDPQPRLLPRGHQARRPGVGARGPHLVHDADRQAGAELAVHRPRARRSTWPATSSAAATSSARSRRRGPRWASSREAVDHPRRRARRHPDPDGDRVGRAPARRGAGAGGARQGGRPAAAPRSRSPDEMLYTVRVEADDGCGRSTTATARCPRTCAP